MQHRITQQVHFPWVLLVLYCEELVCSVIKRELLCPGTYPRLGKPDYYYLDLLFPHFVLIMESK